MIDKKEQLKSIYNQLREVKKEQQKKSIKTINKIDYSKATIKAKKEEVKEQQKEYIIKDGKKYLLIKLKSYKQHKKSTKRHIKETQQKQYKYIVNYIYNNTFNTGVFKDIKEVILFKNKYNVDILKVKYKEV